MYSLEPLTEHNIADSCAKEMNDSVYRHPEDRMGKVAAAIWPWKCKNAIFQYNECFTTLNASKGNGDGQPWDADYGDGTNYQYNYSHGNTASTIMFCGPESINNTFRYNISQYEDNLALYSW